MRLTSLHLNIQAHKSSATDTFVMKTKYVILGLLAPELLRTEHRVEETTGFETTSDRLSRIRSRADEQLVVEKLRTLANFASYDTAFSHILETTDPDLRMLKPRELNFTHSLMRQNYGVAPVGRNVSGTAGIIVSGFLYGGLHMLAWGSTAFTSHLEDIAWKMSCFAVAGGGLFAFAGIFGLDVATKRQQAHRRLGVIHGLCTRKEKRAVKALRYSMTCATIETVSMGYRNGFTVCEAMLHKLQTLSSVPYASAPDPD
ncbi:MAG: hypothetical protein Q9223_002815 [Gallowayella weberi]